MDQCTLVLNDLTHRFPYSFGIKFHTDSVTAYKETQILQRLKKQEYFEKV